MLKSHSASTYSSERSRETQVAEYRAGLAPAAELPVEVRERAAEPDERGVLVDRARDRLFDVGKPSLPAAQHEQLESVGDKRIPTLCRLADRQRLGDEVLRSLKATFHQGDDGPCRAYRPTLGRLAQIVGHGAHRVELDIDPRAIREFPEGL
jgi:hypothetical protein